MSLNIPTGKLSVHKDVQTLSKLGKIDIGQMLFLHERAQCGDPDTADEIFTFIDGVLKDKEVISVWPTYVGTVTITTNASRTETSVNLIGSKRN